MEDVRETFIASELEILSCDGLTDKHPTSHRQYVLMLLHSDVKDIVLGITPNVKLLSVSSTPPALLQHIPLRSMYPSSYT